MSTTQTWAELRQQAIASGQTTEDRIAAARVEQDAYEAGFKLAQLRNHANLSQEEVGDRMGVSQSRVSALERGEIDQMTVSTIRAYLDALGGGMRIVASFDDTDVDLRIPATATH